MTDDLLLEKLGAALATSPPEAPEAAVEAVRHRAQRWSRRLPSRRSPFTRVRAPLGAAAAVALVLSAAATTTGPPRSLRSVAHDVGIPVESPQLSDARAAIRRLAEAVDQGATAAAVTADAEMMQAMLPLDDHDQQRLLPEVQRLHLRALDFLQAQSQTVVAAARRAAVGTSGLLGSAPPAAVAPTQLVVPSPGTPPQPPPRSVWITGIRFDAATATYVVDFRVSGFSPDATGRPGSHTVGFLLDRAAASVLTYAGTSPLSFPLALAAGSRQVCAGVADHLGRIDPASQSCFPVPPPLHRLRSALRG